MRIGSVEVIESPLGWQHIFGPKLAVVKPTASQDGLSPVGFLYEIDNLST